MVLFVFMKTTKPHYRTDAIVSRAEEIARKAHANQKRKGGDPFIVHPEAVANKVQGWLRKAVAWLHDVVEDTPLTLNDLFLMGIPEVVLIHVMHMTREDPVRGPRQLYIEEYIEEIVAPCPVCNPIKDADICHNISTLTPDMIKKGCSVEYIRALIILRVYRLSHEKILNRNACSSNTARNLHN